MGVLTGGVGVVWGVLVSSLHTHTQRNTHTHAHRARRDVFGSSQVDHIRPPRLESVDFPPREQGAALIQAIPFFQLVLFYLTCRQ